MSGPESNRVDVVVHDGVLDITLPASTFGVVDEVLKECARQDSKWGEQNHMPAEWLAILAEEFGEAAKETVGITFAHPWSENYRVELIQTAAVAVRMVEAYDRRRLTIVEFKSGQDIPADVTARQTAFYQELIDRWNQSDHESKLILPRAQNKGQIDDPDDFALTLADQQRRAGG